MKDRRFWDQVISGTGLIVAAVLLVLGGLAIYGGLFGRQNVGDRLAPQGVTFPLAEEMTPEELAEVGDFAGQDVVAGGQAEAYSRYIGLHLEGVNGGATYAQTSAAARAEGLSPEAAEELQGKADTLFKGETLRSILLNAYGWWTVASIALWAGVTMLASGLVLLLLSLLGFRHAARPQPQIVNEDVIPIPAMA